MASKLFDMLRMMRQGGPALCNIAVTNSCNAKCDFCNFANGKIASSGLRWIDTEKLDEALGILFARGIRYISYFGGEPLLHPHLPRMVEMASKKGMGMAMITNGWLLSARLEELARAGLKTVYVSIDSPVMAVHEENRGLPGLGDRIRAATKKMQSLGMTAIAQVTVSKLIGDYRDLVPLLRDLGFEAVAFSYPQTKRLGSSSLAWSDTSKLMDFSNAEVLNALESVDNLRKLFPVNNPHASVADMKRHLRGEPERFVCYGGYKSFYMDWNFDVWRCDAWQERMCSVWDFMKIPLVRDGCTACIADCYRDSSVLLHFAVSLGDALDCLKEGKPMAALNTLNDARNLESLWSIACNAPVLSKLAKRG